MQQGTCSYNRRPLLSLTVTFRYLEADALPASGAVGVVASGVGYERGGVSAGVVCLEAVLVVRLALPRKG